MLVHGASGRCRELRLLLSLLFDFGDLLSLSGRRRDLHAENNVSYFGLRERGHIHVVLLAVVGQNQVLEGHFTVDPLGGAERGPNMVRFGDRGLVGLEDHFGAIVVHMQRLEYENETREGRVRADRLEPVVVQVEQDHLRLGGLQNKVAELLHFETRLKRQL